MIKIEDFQFRMNIEAAKTEYLPADSRDCDRDEFTSRITLCAECEHLRGAVCPLVNQIATVNARRKASRCYAHKWEPIAEAVETRPPERIEIRKSFEGVTNIVILSPWAGSPGGAVRWAVALARYLPRVNPKYRVSAVCVTNPGHTHPDSERELNECSRCITAGESDHAIRAAIAEADIVIQWGLGEQSRLLAHFDGPVIFLAHGACEETIRCIVSSQVKGKITHWAAVSESARDVFPENLIRGVRVIPNGIEPERCVPVHGREATRRAWGINSNQIAVGYLGRFDPDKRPLALIEAIGALPEYYVGVMIGTGTQEQLLRSEASRVAPGRIVFVPPTNLVGDVLAGLDFWFNASKSEGSCLSRREAAFAGVPCISTRVGDLITDVTKHGPQAFILQTGDTGRGMAEVILHAEAAANARYKMIESARRLAWNEYTAPAMCLRWANYLEEIQSQKIL